MQMPSHAAALVTASSPSGCAIHCIAMGATSTGYASLLPAPSHGEPSGADQCDQRE